MLDNTKQQSEILSINYRHPAVQIVQTLAQLLVLPVQVLLPGGTRVHLVLEVLQLGLANTQNLVVELRDALLQALQLEQDAVAVLLPIHDVTLEQVGDGQNHLLDVLDVGRLDAVVAQGNYIGCRVLWYLLNNYSEIRLVIRKYP